MELPRSVRELLWEHGPGSVAGPEWEQAVMERVMARGQWEEMRWLLAHFDRERLRSFLAQRGLRRLPPRELRFWGVICGVPSEEVDRWVTAARERERSWRG